jgi:hypothetical protein
MSKALRVLDDIQIASPCTMRWEDMSGSDRVRHCAACAKNVFNLSDMKADEALELVRGTEGRICVRFYRRKDGTMLTSDCPIGLALVARRAKRTALAAMAMALGVVAALIALFASAPLRRGQQEWLDDKRNVVEVTKRTFERTRDELVVPEMPHEAVAGGLRAPPPVEEIGKMIVDDVQ